MMGYIRMTIRWIWQQKFKGLAVLLLVPVFLLILFPMRDLSDLVTSQVSKFTNNQVYVQFDEMGIKLFPDLGLRLDKFSVETPMLPPLNIQKLVASPSVIGLLTQKPAGDLVAEGIFRGDATVSIRPGKKAENGAPLQNVSLKTEKIQLQDLKQFLALPLNIKGPLTAKADGTIDLTFTNQPDISFELQVGKFDLTSSSVNTIMGPLILPDVGLSRITGKGRLSAGQLLIEDLQLGKEGDELIGKASGSVNLEIKPDGVRPGNYNLKVDLWSNQTLENRAGLFFTLIEKYKVAEGPGHRYRFTVAGDPFGRFDILPLR